MSEVGGQITGEAGPREVTALIGSDGWLFLNGDSNDVLGQHTGAVVPGPEWVRGWSDVLRRRVELMAAIGAEWIYMICPDKESVFEDMLPAEVHPVARRPVHRLLELGRDAGAELIYPLEELIAARASLPVYYRTDTHWTPRAGHLAYLLLCDALAGRGVELELVSDAAIEWTEFSDLGDLGEKLDPPRPRTAIWAGVRGQRARVVADNGLPVSGRRIVIESDRHLAPTCVVFGTSYALTLLAFLAESFRRVVFVHTTCVDVELLGAERPDVVISLTAERGLITVPDDERTPMFLRELEQSAGEAGATAESSDLPALGLRPSD